MNRGYPGRRTSLTIIGGLAGLHAALLMAGQAHAADIQLYVAPNGNVEWSGTIAEPSADGSDGPLPSVVAARDLIRANRKRGEWAQGQVTVNVAPGTYYLDEPLSFGPEDARLGAPAVYRSSGEQRAVISGGREITGWRDVEVNGVKAWAVDIPEVQQGTWHFRQLFVNDQRRARTRLPKEGFYEFAGLPQMTAETAWSQGQTQATFKPGDIKAWKNVKDVEVVALHFWIESRLPLAEVDASANLATFSAPSTFRLTDAHSRGEFARYYVENVFEALDEPGEWYLDRAAGTLYYLPRPGETTENTTIVAPRLEQLVRIAGDPQGSHVQQLGFENLAFAHSDWSWPEGKAGSAQAAFEVPGAIHLENADGCGFVKCAVSHVSNYAVEIAKGCSGIRIDDCELTDLGAGGVKIGHDSSHTAVTNCEIGPGGHIFHSAVGVWIGHSPDNIVSHNEIHHLYYTGVSVGWSWGYHESKAVRNRIEYNHIHHIGQGFLSDMGGIYCLGVSPGTILQYNHIHDVEAHTYGGWGLYTDEGSTHIRLENNIVYRCKHSGFHQHYGSYNIVTNNIFAFGRHAQMMRSREEEHTSFVFEKNIVYCDIPAVLGSQWKNDNYRLDYNTYWRVGGEPLEFNGGSFEDWQKRGHDRHSIIADPMFVDPAHGDFTLKPDSPALKLGFKPIDTSRIGRQRN